MRVAFVSYEYPPETHAGGIGTYTTQTAHLLADAGIDVHVFAGSHLKSSVCSEGRFTVHRVYCKDPVQFQQDVVAVFSQQHLAEPFDLVESPEIHANALRIKQRFNALPLIVRLHASNYLVESLKKKYIPVAKKMRFVLGALRRGRIDLGYWRHYNYRTDRDYSFVRMADYITAPSRQMQCWAVKNWKLKPEQITIIENTASDRNQVRSARTDNRQEAILFYGRLNVLKGLCTATKAMKIILEKNPSWQWIVAGDDGYGPDGTGSMKAWMQKQLRAVTHQVHFQHAVRSDKLSELLQQASIVLIPSLFESFSYVALEAMCAGKAVVGSSGTAIENLLVPNRTGMLAAPESVNAWITSIQVLIDNPGLRTTLGRAAALSADDRLAHNGHILQFYQSRTKKVSYVP